ncbi:carboxymuconolactone decarboxylase family protein [Chitinophaga sp. HK235]|uniref:carboxymuconolactone decarboxylase family protein n=1 Tax=Chitinophaga sp. HK235 TaxID=2952571 RepID=UPI001BA5A517|nr:carboxymuconolactone decarboxylase family protein [Chitinophaga sp. HK235]
MKHYTTPEDKQFAKDLLQGAPRQGKAWLDFDHIVLEEPSAIPAKYKEMIAIAVALTTQCPYCLEKHTGKAGMLGVTNEEMAEVIMIAAAVRSGATLGYGLLTMKLFSAGTEIK